ncbi:MULTISPECIES: LON peptidase substrate-binding domain-containing protein [unclassified Thioalkalivibrio]|uniref:LON peptidase substrate-binding domain-containing protein n=1 Tax=unclassified Thioalkalivibrio TaxID=2621013 RepID=UPI00037D6C17|nr:MULTISPECIES: LON peptidase substrate-binding domain-containing protein [unclassified Thioalkalivibrio]
MTTLPLFPLNTVLFPEGLLPLRIFETRYLDMVRRCLREDGRFVIVAIEPDTESGAPRPDAETDPSVGFHPIGTEVAIVDWDQRPDGLLGILVKGERRHQLHNPRRAEDGLWLAEVEPLQERPDVSLPVDYASLADLLERLLDQLGTPWSHLERRFDDSSWVVGRLTELLPIDLEVKQQLLEADDPIERLERLRAAMLAASKS